MIVLYDFMHIEPNTLYTGDLPVSEGITVDAPTLYEFNRNTTNFRINRKSLEDKDIGRAITVNDLRKYNAVRIHCITGEEGSEKEYKICYTINNFSYVSGEYIFNISFNPLLTYKDKIKKWNVLVTRNQYEKEPYIVDNNRINKVTHIKNKYTFGNSALSTKADGYNFVLELGGGIVE